MDGDLDQKSPLYDHNTKLDGKICGVCGDRALGCNFNAVTCESCKAFFRRNALKKKEFRCPFSENCDITVVTRRFCQKCRLVKCFAIGMRKDFIMSEQAKVLKRQKIETNRAKKRHPGDDIYSKHEFSSDSPVEHSDSGASSSSVQGSFTSECDIPIKQGKLWVTDNSPDQRYPQPQTPEMNSSFISPPSSNPMSEPFPSPTTAASGPSPSSPKDSATVPSSASKLHDALEYGSTSRVTPVSVITHQSPHPCSPAVHIPVNSQIKFDADTPLLTSIMDTLNAPSNLKIRNMSPLQTGVEQHWKNTDEGISEAGPSKEFLSNYNTAREALEDMQRISSSSVSIESILSEAIKLEFEAYSSLTTSNTSSRELNDAERAKLNELVVANKALHEPLDDDLSSLIGDDCRFKINADQSPMLVDVINLTAIAIRRFVKTSKKINAFKNMCQEDQVALLKGGCTEILMLRSAMTYDPDKEQWQLPYSQAGLHVNVDVLKEARGNVYEEHQRFLRTFDPAWRADENIMLILSAISLFTPERPHVVHHDVIKMEQRAYYYLLRRYLESVYPGCEACSIFLKLIQKISELHKLNDDLIRVYFDVNPRDVEPLLIEIFDLKPH